MVRTGSEHSEAQLAVAVAGFLDSCRSANTQTAYGADLAHLAAWCRGRGRLDLLTVDVEDIARYRIECEMAGARPATIARRLSAIASFSAYTAAHEDVPATLVAANIARPTLAATSSAELLSDRDANALLAAADDAGPRTAAAIRLMMLDGLKVGEVIRANAADVRGRSNTTLEIRTGPSRTITLHRETGAATRTYLGRRRDGPLLLSERRGRTPARLSRFGLDYIVKQAAQSAGLEQAVSSNTLRRRYVNAAHTGGADLDTIRHNTGHRDPRTTRRYLLSHDGGPHEPPRSPIPG